MQKCTAPFLAFALDIVYTVCYNINKKGGGIVSKKRIVCCPHCGSTEGIYTKTTYVNVPWCCGFDGEEGYNGEMYDNAERIDGGKIAYCQECDRPICRLSTLMKQWEAER